ncbi:MAG: DUF6773 family protein [Tuberibacillus sp.]
MGIFGKKGTVTDERIEGIRNKVYKEAYILTTVICFISIIVKHFIYGPSLSKVAVEISILVVGSLYCLVRSAALGIFSDEIEIRQRQSKMPMSVMNLLAGIALGVAMALFFGIRSAILYSDHGNDIVIFFMVFFVSLLIYTPVFMAVLLIPYILAKKTSENINKKE